MPVKPNDKWARGNNSAYTFMADNIPRLTTYQEALIHFNAVKPFSKGASEGMKPLGLNRRYDRTQIRKDADNLIIKHYHTDIAIYHSHGGFTFSMGGYDSISTVQILQELLGVEKFAKRNGKAYYFDGMGHAYRIGMKLYVSSCGTVSTEDMQHETRHTINKEGFKAVKDRFKIFTDYAKMVTSLTLGGKGLGIELCRNGYKADHYQPRSAKYILTTDTTRMNWNKKEQAYIRNEFFDQVNNAIKIADEGKRMEAMLPLVEFLSFSASTDYDQRQLPDGDVEYVWKMDNKRLSNFFNELLKFHYQKEVLKLEEVPIGTIQHDSNKKYREYSTEACL
jgi:hypothetical protein